MSPDKYTNSEKLLSVSHNHEIYFHDWGKHDAKQTIINFHGGPGSGTSESAKNKYDPLKQRVIFFDQRGAGKSLPKGKLNHNNTDELLSDIDEIVSQLNLKNLILVGGSWGSTLALCYAIRRPDLVKTLVLDGVFLGSQEEIEWQKSGLWQSFFPDIWSQFAGDVPKAYRDDPFTYYLELSKDKDKAIAKQAIYKCIQLEASILSLEPHINLPSLTEFDEMPGSIELNYLRHNYFLKKDYILKNASKIKAKVYLIQGRYDMVCPPLNAYKLDQVLPDSKLIWTVNGHLKQHEANNILKLLLDES